jgi:hypothetical protein
MVAMSSKLPDTVVGVSTVKTVTLSVDTSAYADGDVLADLQAVTNFMRADGGRAVIQSVTLIDKSDQAVAMDIFISPSAVSLGTENSAPNISDTDAQGLQRICNIASGDYIDLGGCRMATVTGLGLVVEAAEGTTTMYIGAITRGGTPTYAASDLTLQIGLLQD